jgi:large-conductance mechanosensitive channel
MRLQLVLCQWRGTVLAPAGTTQIDPSARGTWHVARCTWQWQWHVRTFHSGGVMNIWTEFKNAILPWLIAAAVIALLMVEHRRTTAALVAANGRLAEAVEVQGRALDGVRDLLAKQGYTLPPFDASR